MSKRRLGLFNKPSGGFSFGNALDFSGGGNVDFTNINIATSETATLSGWVKYGSTGFRYIFSNSTTINFIGITSLTNFRVRWGSATSRDFAVSLSIGVWYHIVITKDASKVLRLYVDSVLHATTYTLTTESANYTDLGYGGLPYDQVLDECGIKKGYVASQSDVDALYNGGAGADFQSVMGASILHFPLNENDPSVITANLGSGGDGVLTGFTVPNFVAH